jgi:hypothetical protein
LHWQYLSTKLQENYTRKDSEEFRPSMVKVETMEEMWDHMGRLNAEDLFAQVLSGKDIPESGFGEPRVKG